MSYLIFDGINDEAVTSSVVNRNLGNQRYTIKGIFRGDNGYIGGLWLSRGIELRGGFLRIYYNSGNQGAFTHTTIVSGDVFEYVITITETSPGSGVNAHTVTLEINNSGTIINCSGSLDVADSQMQTNSEIFLGRRPGAPTYNRVDIERFFYEDLGNAANNVDLDANLSNRTTGTPVLEDQAGSNDATGVNMPTDGSAWSDLSGGGATYTITLDGGSYSYVGGDLSLAANRVINLEQGSYAYTGSDLNLKASRNITLESGSYNYVGGDLTLTYTPASGATYSITLESGSYSVSGGEINLAANRVILLESGSYGYTGQPVTLAANRKITLESGDYNVAGGELDLAANRKITLESGSYSYTGFPMTLDYSGQIISLIDDYSVNYSEQFILANYKDDFISAEFI